MEREERRCNVELIKRGQPVNLGPQQIFFISLSSKKSTNFTNKVGPIYFPVYDSRSITTRLKINQLTIKSSYAERVLFNHINMTMTSALWYAVAFAVAGSTSEGFSPLLRQRALVIVPSTTNLTFKSQHLDTSYAPSRRHSSTLRQMSSNNEGQGPGPVMALFISGVLLFFIASAFAPLIDFASIQPSPKDLNLADSVVTRQDDVNKLKNYQSKFDALSQSKIQDKLRNLPVFFIAQGGEGRMMDKNIYFSFNEATYAASAGDGTVKVTTLDQVLYPLILKRDGFKPSEATPIEVKNALASLGDKTTYNLIPSAAALKEAKDMGTTLKEGEIPLFIVERLAFAGNGGQPQVPLFLEKADGVTSYSRLGKSDDPVVRTTTLSDVLDSMERGSRPAVGQLEFYGNADDVLKADELLSSPLQ